MPWRAKVSLMRSKFGKTSTPPASSERSSIGNRKDRINSQLPNKRSPRFRASAARGDNLGRMSHEDYMRAALEQAQLAIEAGEVPVGAVVVLDGHIVARAFNQPIRAVDPTAHAEVLALRAAAQHAGNYRLTGATLYVTVEPCLMCVGALVHARVREAVFGTVEPRSGALVSTVRGHEIAGLNHRVTVTGGVLEAKCRDLIQQFFRDKRG